MAQKIVKIMILLLTVGSKSFVEASLGITPPPKRTVPATSTNSELSTAVNTLDATVKTVTQKITELKTAQAQLKAKDEEIVALITKVNEINTTLTDAIK